MPLDRLIRGRVGRPRKVLLYGVHGVGKSTWAMSAPDAVGVPTEPGLDDLEGVKFPVARDIAEFVGNLRELYTEDHGFRWMVIDSADWLYSLCIAEAGRINGFTSVEGPDFGKGWKWSDEVFLSVLQNIDKLHQARGLGVIVIAHAQVERFADPARDSYDRWKPKLRKEPGEKLCEWADEVFFATYRVFTTKQELGFGKEETKATGAGERVIFTSERPSHVAKNRLALPDELPLTWPDYERFLTPAAAATAPETAAAV